LLPIVTLAYPSRSNRNPPTNNAYVQTRTHAVDGIRPNRVLSLNTRHAHLTSRHAPIYTDMEGGIVGFRHQAPSAGRDCDPRLDGSRVGPRNGLKCATTSAATRRHGRRDAIRGKPVAMTMHHRFKNSVSSRAARFCVRSNSPLRKPAQFAWAISWVPGGVSDKETNGSALAQVAILGPTRTARDVVCTGNWEETGDGACSLPALNSLFRERGSRRATIDRYVSSG
jgi:hypothetical protein